MNDEDLLEQAASCPTVYLDGLGCFRSINGVLRSVGFIHGSGAQLNLFISLTGAEVANVAARRILDEGPGESIGIWNRARLSH